MLLQLVLVLLFVYGVGIMAALTAVMMYLVRRAAKSRLRLFSVFTSLPRPTVMALANRSIAVSGKIMTPLCLGFAQARTFLFQGRQHCCMLQVQLVMKKMKRHGSRYKCC